MKEQRKQEAKVKKKDGVADLEKLINDVKKDCLYLNGYKPCKPHKEKGVHCDKCDDYIKLNKNILIIKLQAAGEVIRNTSILHRINKEFPNSKIWWLTRYPDLVPERMVHQTLVWNSDNILFLQDQHFDIVYSLDKDMEAASLANRINADVKKGFSQQNGVIIPFDKDAHHKWITGIFDDAMKKHAKNYIEGIFETCGFKWNNEKYILPDYVVPNIGIKTKKKLIGFTTGVGSKWKTRKFSDAKTVSIINDLKEDYDILLLGGPEEDQINKSIASVTGTKYYGTFPFREFIGLMSLCDLVITPVTMAMHIAIGLEKKIILLNNIFPSKEFYLYNLGKMIEPELPCKYCYKQDFDSKCYAKNCMDLVENTEIVKTVKELLK